MQEQNMMWTFLMSDVYVGRKQWASQLEEITRDPNYKVSTKGKITYLNIPAAFDIETTSFTMGFKKCACMYVWSFNINGRTFFGRTWDDFVELLQLIHDKFHLNASNYRLMVWIHNIEYEFQFMCKWIEWRNVFSDDVRKPIYAVTTTGIEFRCSYKLSGYSLAKLGDQLRIYKTQKMVGDLDYSKIRHSETPLTAKEFEYVKQDTKVVVCYIEEQIEKEGGIANIPYTRTGYVRRYCREKTIGDIKDYDDPMYQDRAWSYHNLIFGLSLSFEEYVQCKRAFQGGFTHANARYVGKVIPDVGSIDFTSSYPWIIVGGGYFPMSSPVHVKVKDNAHFQFLLRNYCCIFDIKFHGLFQTDRNETPISLSRCRNVSDYKVVNNGRLVQCLYCETTITELDFETIKEYYRWDSIEIGNMMCFMKGRLPSQLVKAVLDLYAQKTTLKGVEGREFDYLLSKGMLNSCYGMMVTDIVRSNMEYTDQGWTEGKNSPKDQIDNYNKNWGRFLYYPWGVYVTAHARRNLFTGIKAFGDDYIYSDTDSIKAKNMDKHFNYIEEYNDHVKELIEKASLAQGIPEEMFIPRTIKGVEKPIGVWDYEGQYEYFKTLGAKRYMFQKDGEIQFTVAGVKKAAIKKYLEDITGNSRPSMFDEFTDQLSIPAERTGKLTHLYCDDEIEGGLVDYKGKLGWYHEKSYINLSPAPFNLSIVDEFFNYLRGIQHKEY